MIIYFHFHWYLIVAEAPVATNKLNISIEGLANNHGIVSTVGMEIIDMMGWDMLRVLMSLPL